MTDESTASPEALSQQYERSTPPPPAGVAIPARFVYVRFKAFCYLAQGGAQYRQNDALGRPPGDWDEATLEALRRGCEQLVAWRGATPKAPLEGLGIGGFYRLLTLFHFGLEQQSAVSVEGGFLDKMEMVHEVTGARLTLYNKVDHPELDLSVLDSPTDLPGFEPDPSGRATEP